LIAVITLGAAFPAAAQQVLTVYTYDSFATEWGPGPAIKQGFEAECGCTLKIVATDSSIGALRRMQLEGEATAADIVLGLDLSTAAEARATGLFAPHGLDLGGLALPVDWSDRDFVPFDFGWFAFVFNRDLLPEPPSSFEELAASDLDIIIQDPRADTTGFGLMLWVKAVYGDRAAEIWRVLEPRIVTVTPGWSEAYALFLDGEADMVLSYTSSPAYHRIAESDDRFRAARFDEGHYLQVEVAGIVASSPDQDLARQFLAYLVSPEGQAPIPTGNWMYPVNPDVVLPEGFDAPIPPEETLLIAPEDIEAHGRDWIVEMLDAIR
jgi:thiamine transport system substrate-binding protein